MSRFSKVVPLLSVPLRSAALAAAAVALTAALGACSSAKTGFQEDQLLSSAPSPFSRSFNFASADACEASRRALLSQGYMTTTARSDAVDATKNFQPTSDQHIVVEVHVVCTPGDATNSSMVYVNAIQNGYGLKKSATSASVGLSILGSVSVPIRSNSDEMVKISSETIQSGPFYTRFFDLVGRYLNAVARSEPVPSSGQIKITPLPATIEQPVTATASAEPATPTPGSAAPAAAVAAAATGAAVLHNVALPATPVLTPQPAPAPAPTPVAAASAPAAASTPVDHATAAAAAIMGVQPAAVPASVTTHNAAAPAAASSPVTTATAPAITPQTLASTSGGNGAGTGAASPAAATTAAPAASTTGNTTTP
jgi:hypothetical protein